MRRCRASWHSPSAMMTLRPLCPVRRASRRVLHHACHAIGAHAPDPRHAQALQRRLDVEALAAAVLLLLGGEDVLLAGGAGIAVVHDDQHAVVLVEHGAGDAGDEAVVPEAAVAHDADRPVGLRAGHRRSRGERHAVAQDRVALVEGREGRKRVAADVGRDVHRPHLAAQQLHGREHGPLRAAGAEGRRPRRQRRAQRLVDLGPLRLDLGDPLVERWRDAPVAGAESRQPLADDERRVLARHGQHVLAVQRAC